jgi:phosphomevalonate kinase
MNSLVLVLYFSESRNPFVEQAVQYAVVAAHVTFDKDKKDALNKILLQGNV